MSLELVGVSHGYGTRPELLKEVSAEFRNGTATAIMGPSGSGKTTLLSIVGLLQKPRAGEVILDGRPIRTRAETESTRSSMTWLFQGALVLGRRSVADNVSLGGFASGQSRASVGKKVEAALSSVDLDGFSDRRASSLSGGELQRLCVARALVGDPAVVLADEPTGQLDRTNSDLVARLLIESFGPRTAVVIATHDEAVAAACAYRFRLEDGRLRAVP